MNNTLLMEVVYSRGLEEREEEGEEEREEEREEEEEGHTR